MYNRCVIKVTFTVSKDQAVRRKTSKNGKIKYLVDFGRYSNFFDLNTFECKQNNFLELSFYF